MKNMKFSRRGLFKSIPAAIAATKAVQALPMPEPPPLMIQSIGPCPILISSSVSIVEGLTDNAFTTNSVYRVIDSGTKGSTEK